MNNWIENIEKKNLPSWLNNVIISPRVEWHTCISSYFSRVWLFAIPGTEKPGGLHTVYGILQARILEWVAIPSSRGSSWPRDQTCASCASCIAGRLFTFWAPGEVLPVLFGEPQIIVTCKISVLQKPIFSPWEWYRLRSLLYIWP